MRRISRTKTAWASVAAVLLFAGLFLFSGCEKKKPEPPPQQVVVADVVQQDVPIVQEWVGTLQGSVNADIRPKIEGYILKQLYKEGSLVKSGQPLFQIDPRQFKAALDSAKGNLARNKAALDNANIKVERYTPARQEPGHQPAGTGRRPLGPAPVPGQRGVRRGPARAGPAQPELVHRHLPHRRASPGPSRPRWASLVNGTNVLTTVSTVDPIRVVFGISEQQYLNFMAATQRPAGRGQRRSRDHPGGRLRLPATRARSSSSTARWT